MTNPTEMVDIWQTEGDGMTDIKERLKEAIDETEQDLAEYWLGPIIVVKEALARIEELEAAFREMPDVSLEFAKKEDWEAWNIWKDKHQKVIGEPDD